MIGHPGGRAFSRRTALRAKVAALGEINCQHGGLELVLSPVRTAIGSDEEVMHNFAEPFTTG